jgi:hypothetical protein
MKIRFVVGLMQFVCAVLVGQVYYPTYDSYYYGQAYYYAYAENAVYPTYASGTTYPTNNLLRYGSYPTTPVVNGVAPPVVKVVPPASQVPVIGNIEIVWRGAPTVSLKVFGKPGVRYALESSEDCKIWITESADVFIETSGWGTVLVPLKNRQFFRVRTD